MIKQKQTKPKTTKPRKTITKNEAKQIANRLRDYFDIDLADFVEPAKVGNRWRFGKVFPSLPAFLAKENISKEIWSHLVAKHKVIADASAHAELLEYSLILNAGISGIVPPKTFQLMVNNLNSFKWTSRSESIVKDNASISLLDLIKKARNVRQLSNSIDVKAIDITPKIGDSKVCDE